MTCGRRVLQDNTALLHFWIGGEWDFPITPLAADRRRQHEREGNDAGLSRAALYKFECLRNVLSEHQFVSDSVVQAKRTQSRFGGAAIRRVLRIGNRDVTQCGRLERCRRVERGCRWHPNRDPTHRIDEKGIRHADSLAKQPPRVFDVCRKKEVKRCLVLDLREEITGGTIRDPKIDVAMGAAKFTCQLVESEPEIRGGSHREHRWPRPRAAGRSPEAGHKGGRNEPSFPPRIQPGLLSPIDDTDSLERQ